MATLNVFVSFVFDKDQELKKNFYIQSEKCSHHTLHNRSINEPYEETIWKSKARAAIRKCNVVIVLIGKDTHNAPGVIVETDIDRSLKKPVIQVRPKPRKRYNGLTRLDNPIPWKWKRIDAELDAIAAKR